MKKKEKELGNLSIRDDIFISNFKQFNMLYKSQFCLYTAHLYERGKSGEKNAIALNIFNSFFSHLEDASLIIMAIEKWHRNGKIKPIISYFMQEKSGNDWDRLIEFLGNLNLNKAITCLSLASPNKIIIPRYWKVVREKFKTKEELKNSYLKDLDNAFWGIVNSLSIRKLIYFRKAFNKAKHGQRFYLNLDPLSARIFIDCKVLNKIRVDMKTLDLNLEIDGLLEMLNLLVNSSKSMRAFLDWFELCNFPKNVDFDFWFDSHPKYFGKNYKPFNILSFREPRPFDNKMDAGSSPA